MDTEDKVDQATVTVKVITNNVVPAGDAAKLIDEVARGFERYARGAGRRDLRLGTGRVDIGSLIIDLIVIGPDRKVEPTPLAQSFVLEISRMLSVAQGLVPGSTRRKDFRLLNALRFPVASGVADRLVITARPDTKEVIVDGGVVELIDQIRDLADTTEAEKVSPSGGGSGVSRSIAPPLLVLEGKEGTVFNVKGNWYVRLEGEGGVLNPLEPAAGVEVQDGGLYRFNGYWERRSYRIRSAERIA